MAHTPAASSSGRTQEHTDRRGGATHPGDILKARGIHGEAPRSGEILEVLGRQGHERYRVCWEDGRESIVFPADGVSIVHSKHHR